jgi:aldehyde dehydrogenase (NAD+)
MSHTAMIFVNGQWRAPTDGKPLDIIDPATEEVAATILLASEADVDDAVAAARHAFESYFDWTPEARADLLERIVAEFDARTDALTDAVITEMGAPEDFARNTQLKMARERFERAAKITRSYPFEQMVGTSMVVREPIGVCAHITPWNWPLNQAASKLAYSLAAGCTSVWKPSEVSPLSAIILTEAMEAAGVPPGVVNLLQGDGPTVGAAMARHPGVDMVSFTGSTRGGIAVAHAAADTVKRVHQELGGKSANIILPDADFDAAVSAGTKRAFRNTGQSCQAPTRMLVPHDRMDEAAAIAAQAGESMKVGDPRAPGTDLGPLVSAQHWEKVQGLIRTGIEEGATLACGGPGLPDGVNRGYFVRPTVFANVTNDMTIAREEIFGPVLSIIGYRDEADAIAIANDSIYGLAAYISTTDHDRARKLARKLRAGRVYLNYAAARGDVPFGGYRQSGNGREQGVHGLEDFTELKAVLGYDSA